MRNIDRVELASGLLVGVGGCFLTGALDYNMGTLSRMGPGFVPFWLGAIAVLLGGLIVLTAIGRSGGLAAIAWRPAGSILLASVAFGLLQPRLGLVVAVFLAAAISIGGNPEATPRMTLVASAIITFVCSSRR